MKRILLLTTTCLLTGYLSFAQQEFPTDPNFETDKTARPTFSHNLSDPAYTWAVGVQYSYPFYAVSLKYAVSDHSVIQLLGSPMAATYGNYNYSFYGARYVYRFPYNTCPFYGPFTVSYPYLFAGAGLLSLSYPVNNALGNLDHTSTVSDLGWSVGVGYEIILGKHFGIAAEAGYGALTASGANTVTAFTYSGGLHYYFSGAHGHRVHADDSQDAVNPDEQSENNVSDEPANDDQPVKKARKHRRDNDED